MGKKLLEESGRKIITADGLTDAAQKVVAAAKGRPEKALSPFKQRGTAWEPRRWAE